MGEQVYLYFAVGDTGRGLDGVSHDLPYFVMIMALCCAALALSPPHHVELIVVLIFTCR